MLSLFYETVVAIIRKSMTAHLKGWGENDDLSVAKAFDTFSRRRSAEENACRCRRCRRQGCSPRVGKIPWSREWQPTPGFLPGKFRGQKTLEGFSPWGHEESGATERTHTEL